MGFFGNFDKKGYDALDTNDPETNSAPPPPYSPSPNDQASAPPRADLQKDYQSFDQFQQQQVLLNQQQQQNRIPDAPSASSSSPATPQSPMTNPNLPQGGYPVYYDNPSSPLLHGSPQNHDPYNPIPNNNSPSSQQQQQDERYSSPCREINRWCQSLGQGISDWRAEHLRRRQQQQSKRKFKTCCCGITTAVIFIFILIPIFGSIVQSPIDHCIRAGSETWASLPETIPYKEGAVHVHINGGVSGGTIKLQPVPAGQEGMIHTRINVAPVSLLEKMSYSLYHTGQETQLTINVLDNASAIFGACIYVDMTITVPRDTRSVFISASDIEIIANEEIKADFLELKTSNQHIQLKGGWHGDKIVLRTSNAALDFRNGNSLHAIDSIDLGTSNGAIYLDNSDSATGSIHLSTTNGRIETKNTRAATLLDINTSNGKVYLKDMTAPHMVVRTTNGKIELDRISVRDTLTVSTRNGAIRAIVDEFNYVKATFQSSNGKIRVNMPKDFMGPFRVTSSSSAKVAVRGSDVTYEIDKKNEKIGYRYNKYGEGSVDIHTSNARAMLLFI